MGGINFSEVDFIKEFPSGETRGELIDTPENRATIQQAINNGTLLLTGEFFEQIRKENERIYGKE